jgi:hypothetical protein
VRASITSTQLIQKFESLQKLLESKTPNKEFQNGVHDSIKEYDFSLTVDGVTRFCEINEIINSRGLAKRELRLDRNVDGTHDGVVDDYLISDHGTELIFQQMIKKEEESLPHFISVDEGRTDDLLIQVEQFLTHGSSTEDIHLTGLM